jgi:hypothetical protein
MRLNWSNVGRGVGDIADAVREKKLADESALLTKKMDGSTTFTANQGEEAGAPAMPDQQSAQKFADYNNTIAAEDEATFGAGALSSAPKTTVDKSQSYTRADYYADMGKRASALGMHDKAERYDLLSETARDREFNRTRLEASDKRTAESHDQSMKKGDIEISNLERQQQDRARVDGFNAAISTEYEAATKAGKPMPFSRVKEIALEHKLSPTQMLTAYSEMNGIDTAEAGQAVAARARAAMEAARGGLDNMVSVYETNPLFNDGQKLEVKRGKNGQVTLLQNGRPITDQPFQSENQATGFLLKYATDPMSALEFDMSIRKHQAGLRESESKTSENEAQTSSALATAAKTRAETGVIKQGGDGKFKVEANEVSSALGKPALDERGRPITDDYGMQKYTRNPAEEEAFYKWMRSQGILDTNKAIAMWKGGARDQVMPKPEPKAQPQGTGRDKSYKHLWN